MITVRFPTGFSVQYNGANHVDWPTSCDHVHLYERKLNGVFSGWVATVPLSAIIEIVPPCRTYNATTPDVSNLAEGVTRRLSRYLNGRAKRAQKQK